jgi:two-component system, cell cycle sensor histidine kinase and response regulator CckA
VDREETTKSGQLQDGNQPVDPSRCALFAMNLLGQLQDANQDAIELVGYTLEELRAVSASDLFVAGEIPLPVAGDPISPQDGAREVLLRHKEGGLISANCSFSTLQFGEQQAVVAVVQNVRPLQPAEPILQKPLDQLQADIAEQDLRASEARFRTLFNAIPLPTYTWQRVDDDFILTDYNVATLATTDGKIVNLVGMRASELYSDDNRVALDLEECFRRKSTVQREMIYHFRSVDKTQFINATYVYIPDDTVMICIEDITERKRTEQSLRESEERFRSMMQQSPLPTSIFAPDGTLVDANQAYFDLWKLPPEATAMIGRFNALTSKRSIELGIDSTIRRAFSGEVIIIPPLESDITILLRELGIEVREAEKRWLRPHFYPVKDSKGTVCYVVMLHEDVTESKRAEDALNEIQERFEKAFYDSPMPMNILNVVTGKRIEVNNSYIELTGYTREELTSHSLDVFHISVDPQHLKKGIAKLLANGRSRNFPTQIRTKAGEVKDILINSTMIDVEERDLAIVTLIDITERNRTEALLRQLSQAVEQSPVSVMITATDGTIQYVNPKFCEISGYNVDEVKGQTPRILKSGVHSDDFYQHIWQTISSGQVWHGELCNKKKDGELYWESASIVGVKNLQGDITHYVAVKEDITERRRAEEQHTQQERLAAVGQLAAGIAHDFNNILGVIVIYAQMLNQSTEISPQFRKRVEIIRQQAKHASSLIQQILDFSHHSNMEKQPVDLLVLLKEQVRLFKRILPEHIEVQLASDDKNYTLNADPTHMQQIITNLAVNARDAMPAGGLLRITLSKIVFEESDPLPVIGMTAGEWFKVSISDTGPGMSAEVMEHIFEPFFTTKERGQGTGLGLAQVYGIVRQHGGYIHVTSQPGNGATFDLYFPPLAHPADAQVAADDLVDTPQGTGKYILLVEDNEPLRLGLGELLAGWDYNVIEASNGLEAVSILAEGGAAIDLVISDVIMPKMGGADLFAHIKERYPHIPVVFMTGHFDESEMKKFELLGLKKWLSKPVDIPTLAQVVADLIGEKSY